jgi:hypothetical protein
LLSFSTCCVEPNSYYEGRLASRCPRLAAFRFWLRATRGWVCPILGSLPQLGWKLVCPGPRDSLLLNQSVRQVFRLCAWFGNSNHKALHLCGQVSTPLSYESVTALHKGNVHWSPPSSRTATHDSGSAQVAPPSLRWTSATYSLPVLPAHHSRYGLPARQSPMATLSTEGFSRFVTSTTAPITTSWSDSCRAGLTAAGRPCLLHGARNQ